jgi:hypothetical protein
MRAIKVITKEADGYHTELINLEKVTSIICTYPKDDDTEPGSVEPDIESAIASNSGCKIEFICDMAQNIDFDLDITPTKFIIYDDYGNELEKTDDLEEVEAAILTSMSNADPDVVPESDIPPVPPAPQATDIPETD